MKMYVSRNSSWRSSSRFSIWDWIETSSADTGSSAIDELRPQGERPGDPDPLPLPAGELVREAVVVLRRQADRLEQLLDLHLLLLLVADLVDLQGVADDRADPLARVQ